MNLNGFLGALVLTCFSVPAHAACEQTDGTANRRAASPSYWLNYQTDPAEISVAEHFALDIEICAKNETPFSGSLGVDAHMPMHKHAMNYRPKVKSLGGGNFRAEGFLFHMPGLWQFTFDIRGTEKAERVTWDQSIK